MITMMMMIIIIIIIIIVIIICNNNSNNSINYSFIEKGILYSWNFGAVKKSNE